MTAIDRRGPVEQLHDLLADDIAAGRLADGIRLPSLRALAAEHEVSTATAGRAVAWLRDVDHQVVTDATGSYVRAGRYKPGPVQRLAWTGPPPGEHTDVIAADYVDAAVVYPRVITLLGLEPTPRGGVVPVVRREQRYFETDRDDDPGGGRPFALSVEWFPGELSVPCPELLHRVPLADPRGALPLIAERTADPDRWPHKPVTFVRGRTAYEARRVLDDGREAPLLGLRLGDYVSATVWMWFDPDGRCWSYLEQVTLPGKVLEVGFDLALRA
jgi:hypothetical protein